MISLSRILTGKEEKGDSVRYRYQKSKYPLVLIFNITRNCNLFCLHCYSSSGKYLFKDLPLNEWKRATKQAAEMGVKHIIFSGGEPLCRKDLIEIIKEAKDFGINTELSTNGTLLNEEKIGELKRFIDYIGISIDGPEIIHDEIRGLKGAFRKAIEGIRIAKKAGIKTGIRFTITKLNFYYLSFIFDLLEKENIERVCFYHLVYSGRADKGLDISNDLRIKIIEKICNYAMNSDKEVLTADNSVDNVFVYKKKPSSLSMLKINGGNKSGERIAAITPEGIVQIDQFTRIPIGRIEDLKKPWDNPHPLINNLRNRKEYLPSKCKECEFFEICNGNLRQRALATTGNFWGEDPSCYVEEIKKYN